VDEDSATFPVFLVGNKTDTVSLAKKKEVTTANAKSLSGPFPVFEVSAKTDEVAIYQLFETVTKSALAHRALRDSSRSHSIQTSASQDESKQVSAPLSTQDEITQLKRQVASLETTVKQMQLALASLGVWPLQLASLSPQFHSSTVSESTETDENDLSGENVYERM